VLRHSDYGESSLFAPENLLREARRQKSIPKGRIPRVCLLDPDGDIVRHLIRTNRAKVNRHWACYHTEMYNYGSGVHRIGIVGNAVGSPFAVLVAEEMFASGCHLLVSMTSAGRIREGADLPRFLVISRALRDEGTSHHYVGGGDFCRLERSLLVSLASAIGGSPVPLGVGTSWTTDAPFRETAAAIRRARKAGVDCVEMEAAALYAFARVRAKKVICIAHVTNTLAQRAGDFEKGAANGATDSLRLVEFVLGTLGSSRLSDM
jgi:uridine phosphorylase